MIAEKYVIRAGVGVSDEHLPSFDKALIDAGVGNYNLVRLSSILPAGCKKVDEIDLTEGSLLPTAYSTISSSHAGDFLVSAIGVGIPEDGSHVGVIMEHSAIGKTVEEVMDTLVKMIQEAFDVRGWKMSRADCAHSMAQVVKEGENVTTFACIAEW